MFHRKRLSSNDAKAELDMIGVADRIDPDNLWHIGHPTVEHHQISTDGTGMEWTLVYPYGGRSLVHLHHESPTVIKIVLTNLKEILKGLSAFHRHGLYHRDVKVSNILYQTDGAVRLIDFGIATTVDQADDPIYQNIYPVWPFEMVAISGTEDDIFSYDVFGEYTKHQYIQDILEFHMIDTNDFRLNIIALRKKYGKKLHQAVTKGIDIYSFGVTLTHLLLHQSIRNALNIKCYRQLKSLARQMIEPYTDQRIDTDLAYAEWPAT